MFTVSDKKPSIVNLYTANLAVIALLLFVLYYLYPPLLDDVRFPLEIATSSGEITVGDFFSGWFSSVRRHFLYDNSRFAQLIAQPCLFLPKVVNSVIMAFINIIAIYYIAKIADVWKKNYAIFSFIIFCWIFVLPWADNMFVVMYTLNYILPSAILLYGFYKFITHKYRSWVGALILGVFLGISHELCAGPALVGVCAVILFSKKYRDRESLLFVAGITLGLLYLYLVPGTRWRSDSASDFMFLGFLNPLLSMVHAGIVFLYIFLASLSMAVRRWRSNICMPCFIGLSVMLLVAFVLWRAFVFCGLRTSCCMDVVGIAGCAYLLGCCPVFKNLNRVVSAVASGVMMLTVLAHIAACIPWFNKMKEEVENYNRIRSSQPHGVIFCNLTNIADAPVYLLGKPNFNVYGSPWGFIGDVIPDKLRHFNEERACEIKGNAGAMIFENSIVLDTARTESEDLILELYYGSRKVETNAEVLTFQTEDGAEYKYLKLGYVPLRTRLSGPITAVDIVG